MKLGKKKEAKATPAAATSHARESRSIGRGGGGVGEVTGEGRKRLRAEGPLYGV